MPTDYRDTDKHLRLVMTLNLSLFAALGKGKPLVSTAVGRKFDI